MKNENAPGTLVKIVAILILVGLIIWGVIAFKSNGYTFDDVISWVTTAVIWGFVAVIAVQA